MATTWETILKRAKRRMGLPLGREDALLRDLLFLDALNDVLAVFAGAEGFREEITLDLATAAVHALSSRVVKILDNTVRVDYDGSGDYAVLPARMDEAALRRALGMLENADAGIPAYYYTQRGSAADAMLSLVLHPRSDTARTNGIKLWAQVAAPAVSALTGSVPVQQHEERFLLPGICLALAEATAAADPKRAGLVPLWDARWEQAQRDYADLVEDGRRGSIRRIHHSPWELD